MPQGSEHISKRECAFILINRLKKVRNFALLLIIFSIIPLGFTANIIALAFTLMSFVLAIGLLTIAQREIKYLEAKYFKR